MQVLLCLGPPCTLQESLPPVWLIDGGICGGSPESCGGPSPTEYMGSMSLRLKWVQATIKVDSSTHFIDRGRHRIPRR